MTTHSEQLSALSALREKLSQQLGKERIRYFGNLKHSWVEYADEYFWDESQQDFRLKDLLRQNIPKLPGSYEIWRFLQYIKSLGQREISVNLFVCILKK